MNNREQRFYSIIIPLYNRPQEIKELLQSLTRQQYRNFEVIVIDDGSVPPAREEVAAFASALDLQYIYQENSGQGFARNLGFQHAKGDYFIVFDSDCLIPEDYLLTVKKALQEHYLDAYGGPDLSHRDFTALQKAIGYAMTSPLSTGGIRGNKHHIGTFHPRSFNLGVSREAWERSGGFHWTNQSEDMELSIRMHRLGLRVGLIPEAGVYHKRRLNLRQFFRQTFSFGQGRIRLFRHFGPSELKLVHCLPALFVLGLVAWLGLFLAFLLIPSHHAAYSPVAVLLLSVTAPFAIYKLLLFFHAWLQSKSLKVAYLSVLAVFTQFTAYGSGFLRDLFRGSNNRF